MDLTVRFIVNKTKQLVEKKFDSYAVCKKFVNKMKRSKTCELVAYPNFRN